MKPTPLNDSKLMEITQRLMTHGTEAFLEVMGKIYNLAMKFERELHLNAYSYERSEHRTGYAGFKPKTLKTAAGMLKLKIPQVRGSEEPFYPSSLVRGIRSNRAFKMVILKCTSRVFQPERFRMFFMNFAVLMLVQIKSLGRHEN